MALSIDVFFDLRLAREDAGLTGFQIRCEDRFSVPGIEVEVCGFGVLAKAIVDGDADRRDGRSVGGRRSCRLSRDVADDGEVVQVFVPISLI